MGNTGLSMGPQNSAPIPSSTNPASQSSFKAPIEGELVIGCQRSLPDHTTRQVKKS